MRMRTKMLMVILMRIVYKLTELEDTSCSLYDVYVSVNH